MIEKEKAYRELVADRKKCSMCQEPQSNDDRGLSNPSKVEGGIFDCNHIGHWSRWQGNLNAKLLVVGQDWGSVKLLRESGCCEPDGNPTNETLRHLLHVAGYDIPQPSKGEGGQGDVIFLTNAILCVKNGRMSSPVRQSWANMCGKQFLIRLVEIIQPEMIVSLGLVAYQMFRNLYDLPKMRFREAVEQQGGFLLASGVRYFPRYHCSPIVRSYIRPLAMQEEDWSRIA